jgi:polysaccharide export outer membrane protein
LLTVAIGFAAVSAAQNPASVSTAQETSDYVLGTDDQLRIWALGVDEITEKPVRIDSNGYIDVPLVGRVRAAGMTAQDLRATLIEKLSAEVKQPQVSIEVVGFGSQPVSILGAVNTPGVHQLQGRRTLVEVLSMAGGLRNDAGNWIKITRSLAYGPLPLANLKIDASGEFSTAEVNVQDLLAAKNPRDNIAMRPRDTVTVPTADVIYVLGAVRKPGAFVINGRERVSVLQALAMAEGLAPTPAPKNSRVLRDAAGQPHRTEIPVNVSKIIANQAEDIALRANDILYIPTSTQKKVAIRTLEAAVQVGTGVLIWRR